jgi:hypothetical protein
MFQRVRPVVSFAAPCAALVLWGCAVAAPDGPSVMALPAKGESLQSFRAQDASCRAYAAGRIGKRQPAVAASTDEAQERYDVAYTQCMYARGDTVVGRPPSAYAGGYVPYDDYPFGYIYNYPSGYLYGPTFWPGYVIRVQPRVFRFHRFGHFRHFGRSGPG